MDLHLSRIVACVRSPTITKYHAVDAVNQVVQDVHQVKKVVPYNVKIGNA